MIGTPKELPPAKIQESDSEEKSENVEQQKFKKSLLDEIQFLKEEIAALKEQSKTEKDNISIEKLKNLVSDDKLADCFQILNLRRKLFSHDTDKTFIAIKGEWSQLKKQELLGFIDYDTISRSSSKIRYKLLTFIDVIELEES